MTVSTTWEVGRRQTGEVSLPQVLLKTVREQGRVTDAEWMLRLSIGERYPACVQDVVVIVAPLRVLYLAPNRVEAVAMWKV